MRGRNDRQLERTIGSKTGLRVIFKGMERAFMPERSKGFEGEIQYVFHGSNGYRERKWVVKIADGRARAKPGEANDPTLTLTTSVPTFARIAAGETHPAKAMLEGAFEVTGDFDIAVRLGEMFGEDSLV